MGKLKGSKKTGGRKKGTMNKKTQDLHELIFNKLGQSVPERLIELLPDVDEAKAADILLKLMEYMYPKRKAVEINDRSDRQILSITDLVALHS